MDVDSDTEPNVNGGRHHAVRQGREGDVLNECTMVECAV